MKEKIITLHNKSKMWKFGIIIAILMINSAVGLDPTLNMRFKKLEVLTKENPYIGTMTSELSNSGDTMSYKIPIKAAWPEETLVSTSSIEFGGIQVFEATDNMCELMDTKLFVDSVEKYGLPKDKFPRKCPFTPGSYEISKFGIPLEEFPPGIPSGDYDVFIDVGELGKDPWVKMRIILEVTHTVLGLPPLPIPLIGR